MGRRRKRGEAVVWGGRGDLMSSLYTHTHTQTYIYIYTHTLKLLANPGDF